ncbi:MULTISPECIES: hypothetical protein [Streptomyces]|uniref:Secreted protein n=1 Tax=Streptomyces gilvifuscus TaxID=1550617 RepID=A0ABT5G6N0_9ACTN|nr:MULTISPECIES: hypothetical protein [Streptomyces]MBK3642672.1 hypothetical protein [Streptomyces sp. MBT33]MDC2960242.1 hypothetical protein [Streptomyces gilvifuscus]
MAQAVLAVGTAFVTASGCVWYVPALVDLRAGADRPDSRRFAAAACLSGWGTAGLVAVLLLVAQTWWPVAGAAAVGAVATVGLRIRSLVRRREERREVARHWAALTPNPPRHGRGDDSTRYVFAALLGSALAVAAVAAAVAVSPGTGGGVDWLVAAAPVAVAGLILVLAATHARTTRRTGLPATSAAEERRAGRRAGRR